MRRFPLRKKKHLGTSVLFPSISVFVIGNLNGRINDGTNYIKVLC
jgi:hypothetical protein